MTRAAKPRAADRIRVRFLGVRGSFPVSGEGFLHFGGNTSCVEILAGGHDIVCDMGTGIIPLGHDLLRENLRSGRGGGSHKPLELVMLVSHAHHDHTQGFPFFKPAYLHSSVLHIFGPRLLNEDFSGIMTKSMSAPLFPVDLADMHSTRVIRNIEEPEVILLRRGKLPEVVSPQQDDARMPSDAVVVSSLKNMAHPKGGVMNFRITYKGRSVVYATDVEGYVGGDARLIDFSRGADLLIHDAQYLPEEYCGFPVPTQGFGHSTFEMAVAVARAAGVKRLALFHHDPSHSDDEIREIERQAKKAFPDTFAAYEGLEIDL
jgi:phosphoribosyl 1,2-cyclic phosphodiesterase